MHIVSIPLSWAAAVAIAYVTFAVGLKLFERFRR